MSKRAGLRDSTIKLLAGAPEDIPADGNYLRISAAVYPVIVEVGGNDIYKLQPGEDVTYPIDGGFTRVRLSTLAPIGDDVTVTIGNNVKVGSVLVAGSVAISGEVKTSDEKNYTGAVTYHKAAGAVAVGVHTQLIDPIVNTNGLILLGFDLLATYATSFSPAFYLMAKTAAQTFAESIILQIDNRILGSAAGAANIYNVNTKRFIPPGMGVYFSDLTAQNNSVGNITYKAL